MKDSSVTWFFGLAWSVLAIVMMVVAIIDPSADRALYALSAMLLGQIHFHRAEYQRDQGR